MSLLGFDTTGSATINGLTEINANNVFSDVLYYDADTTPVNVKTAIDALQASIGSITPGYYFLGASTNNPGNTLSEKKLYYSQQLAQNGFTLVGTGTSATQITATYAGVYNISYKINYQKVNNTVPYEVKTWIMKNGVDVDYTATIQTMDASSQWMQVMNQFTVTLAANDYLEVVWYSPNANASSDILDFINSAAPSPQVSSQTVMVTQISNVLAGTTGATGPQGPVGPQGAQGPQGPQGDTGPVSGEPIGIAALALATATAATLGGYIVSNDAVQVTQNAAIATNTTDIATDEGRITILEVKTTDQSWSSLQRTTFSGRLNVGATSAGVTLYDTIPSTFGSGISASAAITSSAGTSQFSSLLINTTAEITNDLTITNGELYVTRNTLTSSKKIVLYDNTTGNDYDYLGFWTDSGTASKKFLNAEIDGVAGSAFQWYYGDGLGSSRTLAKSLSSAQETGYTASAKFLKSSGASQEINLVRDTPNNAVSIDMLGDTAGLNAFDGQIIQEQGNGVDDNTGTMTIQSGGIDMFGLTSGFELTGLGINMTATTNDINITSAGLTAITAAGIASISSTADALLLNGYAEVQITSATGGIDLSSGFGSNITASTGDVNITSTLNEIQIVAYEDLDLTSQTLNVNITSNAAAVVLGAATTLTTTSTGTTAITSTGGDINIDCFDVLVVDCGSMNFNSVGGASMNVASTVNITSSGGAISFNAGAGQDFSVAGCDQCFITTETLTGVAFQHNSAATSNDNMRLIATGGYIIRIGEGSATNGVAILGVDSGTSSIDSNASSLTVRSDAVLTLRGDTSVTTTSATNINATGGNATNIGNASSTTTQLGTININTTGSGNTSIGNATGITTFTGTLNINDNVSLGSTSADSIIPNGTLTKPLIIGTYASQSSYSTTSTTPLTTYLGGTLESTNSFTNSPTGTFRYIMASVTPFDANGGITLSAGTYMFWLAINFEDAAAFNMTDLRMGLSNISTLTTASSEATIVASLPNLTCYFHKTDAADAAGTDSENRTLSACFRLGSSTTVYPFYDANHSVTVDTVTCNTIFVKIGSA